MRKLNHKRALPLQIHAYARHAFGVLPLTVELITCVVNSARFHCILES